MRLALYSISKRRHSETTVYAGSGRLKGQTECHRVSKGHSSLQQLTGMIPEVSILTSVRTYVQAIHIVPGALTLDGDAFRSDSHVCTCRAAQDKPGIALSLIGAVHIELAHQR